MQGDVPTEDLIFGSIVLAVFLVFVFAAGYVLARFKNARYARAWQPLVPVIGGRVIDDGGGAAASYLAGTYKGRKIRAAMIPDRNRYTVDSSGHRYNYFDVALLELPGRSNWEINERPKSPDRALEQRLINAGAMDVLNRIGPAEASYNSGQRTLTIIQEPGWGWIPPRDHFEAQLDALLRLADINTQVN